jgi:hypothetical protein
MADLTPTTNLSLPLITTGTQSGTWGSDVNNGLTAYLDICIAGTLSLTSASFTSNALTLANTAGNSSSDNISTTTAQYYILKLSSLAAGVTITAPSTSKSYIINNTDSTYGCTIKASGQSGVTIVAGEKALVIFNGTDYIKVSNVSGSGTFTSLTATGAITFNTTTNNQSYTTTGAGTITISSGTLGTINNMSIGATTPSTGAFTTLSTTGNAVFGGTGAITAPAGTTAQQPGSPATGMLRFNTTRVTFEGYNGTAWASVGGATLATPSTNASYYPTYSSSATAGDIFSTANVSTSFTFNPSTKDLTAGQMVASGGIFVNSQTISASYTIATGYSATSSGPITLASGVSVTLGTSARWVIL